MKIQRNRNPCGRMFVMLYGLVEVIDGLVRVFSFGFCHTTGPLDISRTQSRKYFAKMKKEQNANTR